MANFAFARSAFRRASLFLLGALSAGIAAAASAGGGFLFVTFKGEQTPMSEQVYFALSKDGRSWQALNNGNPALVTQLGEKGARDPFIIRSHDGKKTYLIATDLSIHLTRHDWTRAVRAGSRSILVWETTDLVNWSEPRLVEVAPDDAGCTWAPEAIYDEQNRDYVVFWASTTGRDEFAKHRIWAARTKDFREFGEPFVFIEKPTTIIDTTIIHDGQRYHRFTKDERDKAITMESSDALAGPWREVEGFSLRTLRGYEGPSCYLVEPATADKGATWCLILDHYARGQGYQPFLTDDLASGRFERAEGFQFPFRFRHGSVLPVSEDEYARILAARGPKQAATTPEN